MIDHRYTPDSSGQKCGRCGRSRWAHTRAPTETVEHGEDDIASSLTTLPETCPWCKGDGGPCVHCGEGDIVETVARHLLNAVIEDRSFGSDRPKISVARYRQHAKDLVARLRRSAPREVGYVVASHEEDGLVTWGRPGRAHLMDLGEAEDLRVHLASTHVGSFTVHPVGPPIGDEGGQT